MSDNLDDLRRRERELDEKTEEMWKKAGDIDMSLDAAARRARPGTGDLLKANIELSVKGANAAWEKTAQEIKQEIKDTKANNSRANPEGN